MVGIESSNSKKHWLTRHLTGLEHTVHVGSTPSYLGNVELGDPVSSHPYNQSALKLIEVTRMAGGMALDCGAGQRDFTSEHLVQIDIAPCPNVDILCDAQALPFVDSCFDLVMSFSALEHIANPFLATAEIKRVLKPGGIIYVDAPQIVAEHGYPSHFFNMTRFGLRKLFEGMTLEAHSVPTSGQPAIALHSIAAHFRAGLSAGERDRFDKMTLAELLAIPPKELGKMLGRPFDSDRLWKIAATTCAIFRKPGPSRLEVPIEELPQFRSWAG